ncbi:hypothetical protein [Streptomyces sp. NPDC002324]
MTVEMPSAPLPEAVREHDAEWVEYLDKLAAAVEAADPGTSFDWETRERLRISAWVRHVYDHPSSATLFTWPEPRLAAEMRRREIAALAGRLDAGKAVARPARPACEVWAAAAVAAVWEITAAAVTSEQRPPRERVVRDAWSVVRTVILPAVDRFTPVFRRASRSW